MKMFRASLLCKDSESVHFLPLSSTCVSGPSYSLGRAGAACLHSNVWQGPMVKRRGPIQAQHLVHLFSTIQSVCSKCHTQQLKDAHWRCGGFPRSAREGSCPVVYTGVTVAAQAKPNSFAAASLWQRCMGCEGRQVADTGLARQILEQDGSQYWKAVGDRYTCRCQLERFVIHGKDCLCLLEMTWRWPVFNNTRLWANKRVNQTVRSWGAQIKMSKLGVMSPSELIRHYALFQHCQSFHSHLMHGLNIKGWAKGAGAGHYQQTTLYERSYVHLFSTLFQPPASKNPIIEKSTTPYC